MLKEGNISFRFVYIYVLYVIRNIQIRNQAEKYQT